MLGTFTLPGDARVDFGTWPVGSGPLLGLARPRVSSGLSLFGPVVLISGSGDDGLLVDIEGNPSCWDPLCCDSGT